MGSDLRLGLVLGSGLGSGSGLSKEWHLGLGRGSILSIQCKVMSRNLSYKILQEIMPNTDPDGAVVMSSVSRLVGTGFACRYRLQSRACFQRSSG